MSNSDQDRRAERGTASRVSVGRASSFAPGRENGQCLPKLIRLRPIVCPSSSPRWGRPTFLWSAPGITRRGMPANPIAAPFEVLPSVFAGAEARIFSGWDAQKFAKFGKGSSYHSP
jgi:hypothetical protein